MILVTGASGTIGREVVKALAARGARFKAGYRSRPPQAAPGVEAVQLDFDRPETVRPALDGVETLFLLSNAVEPERNVLREAKAAGVRRVLKLSVIGAVEEAFTFARWHRAIEREIEASGLAWTFLRPNGFMQNVVNYMGETIRGQGAIFTSAADAKISHVDARDVGAVGAAVLAGSGHEGRAYTLTGPAAITYNHIAATLSRVRGKPVQCVPISDEDHRQGAIAAGIPAGYAEALVDLNRFYRTGGASAVSAAVREVLGRDPISFEQFARDHAAALP